MIKLEYQVASFDTTVLNALNRCEAFAMEVLLDEINMRGIQKAMMMPEGKYLNTLLSPEDFALQEGARVWQGLLRIGRVHGADQGHRRHQLEGSGGYVAAISA